MNINVIAIQRSGHTAISVWLTQQGLDEYKFTEYKKEHNTKKGYSCRETPNTLYFTPHKKNFTVNGKLNSILYDNSKKHVLLDSQAHDFSLITSEYEAPIEVDFHLIILRDCFNNFASLVRQIRGEPDRLQYEVMKYREAWKSQAREALGITHYLQKKEVILYNNWFQSEDYRKSICDKLNLTFTDGGLLHVPYDGSGSSFDGLKYNNQATSMNVMNRYIQENNEPFFHELLEDEEMIKLNSKLFKEPRPENYNKYLS